MEEIKKQIIRQPSLTIVIPQYNEDEEKIKPLLSSIETQVGIDFNTLKIIIVNDHSETKLNKEFLDSFKKLSINYIETPENRGPGQARQYGIDHTETDYVMFADADDRLFACNVLTEIANVLDQSKEKPFDIIYTKWIEEISNESMGYLLLPHNPDMTWVHGKVIRVKFLRDRNLRFNENIRVHEDSYFNTVVQMNAETSYNLDIFSYFWSYNENSLTRKKYKYNYLVETAPDLVKSINDTMDTLIQRRTNGRDEYIIKGIFFMYFLLQAPYWNENLQTDPELRALRETHEKALFDTISKYKDSYQRVSRQDILRFKNDERAQCCINTGFETEVETWEQFVTRLDNTYGEKPKFTHTCDDCKHKGSCDKMNECTMTLDEKTNTYSTPLYWEPVEEVLEEKEVVDVEVVGDE